MKRFLSVFPVPKYLSLGAMAVAIDYDVLRFIEFSPHGKRAPLRSFGAVSLPKAFAKNSQNSLEEIRGPVLSVMAKTKASGISVVIPEQSAYVFTTVVPLAEPALVREAISFKLEEHVPIALADALFEYDIVSVDTIKNTATAAVRVVPRQQVESMIRVFQSEKCFVFRCDTESKALAKSAASLDGGTYLVIHIGKASTVFVVARNGVPLFSSALGASSLEIIQAAAKIFSVPVKETSELRQKLRSVSNTDGKLFDALVPTLAAIRDEANTVVDYWNSHEGGEKSSSIKSIFLSGEDAVFPSVMAYLELSFDIPIAIADVWRNSSVSKKTVPPLELERALGFSPVIGAAINAIDYV